MLRIAILSILLLSLLIVFACSSTPTVNNANSSNGAVNTAVNIDAANMPPGLSMSPLPPGNLPPGIPANLAPLPKGATPTPGIPSAEELKKPRKPGATPTPGIPSPEELRKQMGIPPPSKVAPANSVPMMKMTKKPTPTPE